jgi:Scramblase
MIRLSSPATSRFFQPTRLYSRLGFEKFTRRPPAVQPAAPKLNQIQSTAEPNQVAYNGTGLASVLNHPKIVAGRQMEMLNIFIGFEQANKYTLKLPDGSDVGFIAEEDTSFSNSILRQLLRTRRRLSATVLDSQGNVVLKVSSFKKD